MSPQNTFQKARKMIVNVAICYDISFQTSLLQQFARGVLTEICYIMMGTSSCYSKMDGVVQGHYDAQARRLKTTLKIQNCHKITTIGDSSFQPF